MDYASSNFATGCGDNPSVYSSSVLRADVIPMHAQLADGLLRIRPAMVHPKAKVFATAVTDVTRRKDFRRAGAGIPLVDDEGCMVDLHALRTTPGTRLAQHGAKPQGARRIIGHSDYQTTLKRYIVLGLTDTAAAINQLPNIGGPETAKATGTADTHPQQSQHETKRIGASQCDKLATAGRSAGPSWETLTARGCEVMQAHATIGDGIRGCNSVVECQLPKLDVVGSNPITRSYLTRVYGLTVSGSTTLRLLLRPFRNAGHPIRLMSVIVCS